MLQSDLIEECFRMVEEATTRAVNCSDAERKAEWLQFAGECLKLVAQYESRQKPGPVNIHSVLQ